MKKKKNGVGKENKAWIGDKWKKLFSDESHFYVLGQNRQLVHSSVE